MSSEHVNPTKSRNRFAAPEKVTRLLARLPQPPKSEDFGGETHNVGAAARIGLWLGIAFGLCMLTGLISHFIQHPVWWFPWPSRPVWLYRVNQGIHVLSGVAAIPLILAKVWSVYPHLFTRPAVRSVAHGLERVGVLVLVAAAFFELITGLVNVTGFYPWSFAFPAAHYAVAWIAIGALLVHIAAKLTRIRVGLGSGGRAPSTRPTSDDEPNHEPGAEKRPGVFTSRRAFLRTTGLATGAAVAATAGVTIPWLREVSVLGWRSGRGPQNVPVNRTAIEAGVTTLANRPDWKLELVGRSGTRELSLAELGALEQHSVSLPIACVEGWSADATWTGVRLMDLVRLVQDDAAGNGTTASVEVDSLEPSGPYRRSVVPPGHVFDPLTLIALRLNGSTLTMDHGFPCRLIAPNRPGVLQTKWVRRLRVTA